MASTDMSENSKQFCPPGTPADKPPPKKAGWDHSERCLVYYEASPELGLVENFGIAYYHYNPPFEKAHWVDFAHHDRTPSLWWFLPDSDVAVMSNEHAVHEQNEYLKSLIRNLLSDLPMNRDWMNPHLERQMKEASKK